MMAQIIPDFKKVKDSFFATFGLPSEPDWLIKKNESHQSAGMSIWTEETVTRTVLDWFEVNGYQLQNIKPDDSGKVKYFFVEVEV